MIYINGKISHVPKWEGIIKITIFLKLIYRSIPIKIPTDFFWTEIGKLNLEFIGTYLQVPQNNQNNLGEKKNKVGTHTSKLNTKLQ